MIIDLSALFHQTEITLNLRIEHMIWKGKKVNTNQSITSKKTLQAIFRYQIYHLFKIFRKHKQQMGPANDGVQFQIPWGTLMAQ